MAHLADIILLPVKSSNIGSMGHDPESNTLIIEFKRGGRYSYSPVTEEGYLQLSGASSIGKHFLENIRNNPGIDSAKL